MQEPSPTLIVGLRGSATGPPPDDVSLDALLDAYVAVVVGGGGHQAGPWYRLEASTQWFDESHVRAIVQIGWDDASGADVPPPVAAAIAAAWQAFHRAAPVRILGLDLIIPRWSDMSGLGDAVRAGSGWIGTARESDGAGSPQIAVALAVDASASADHLAHLMQTRLDRLEIDAISVTVGPSSGHPLDALKLTADGEAERWIDLDVRGPFEDPAALGWLAAFCVSTHLDLGGAQLSELHMEIAPAGSATRPSPP